MTQKLPSEATGWNTWDFRSFNTITYLEDATFHFKLHIAVYDPDADILYDTFRWNNMPMRGPHAPDGRYWSYTFTTPRAGYAVEAAASGQGLDLCVTPLTLNDNARVLIKIMPAGECPVRSVKNTLQAGKWRIIHPGFSTPDDEMFFVSIDVPYVLAPQGKPASLHINTRAQRYTHAQIQKRLATARAAYEKEELTGTGALDQTLMAVPRSVTWNTIYDARWTGVATQISRDWGADWNGSYNFPWDQFFMGYLAHTVSPALSKANFMAILASATKEGFLPNYYASFGVRAFDRSQPPIGAYLVWKTYGLTHEKALLEDTYAGLKKWHDWWFTARDPNKTGLLSWGSNNTPEYEFPHLDRYNPSQKNEHICALYEAGMDNFPVMNHLSFDKKKQTLTGHCIGLNSLYTMDCEALGRIADVLGKTADAKKYAQEADAMRERARARLYDKETGLYHLRAWNGTWIREPNVLNFYALAAGIPTPEQARTAVEKYLTNEEYFWGEFVISVTAKNNPSTHNNDYWAGRIWPPTNFIVYEGLKRYKYDDVAAEFALKSLRCFEKGWLSAHQFCENYNLYTGEGSDVWNSSTGYGWGALMPNFALQELIDIEPWSGKLRLGTRSQQEWGVKAYTAEKINYRVESSYDGLTVWREGKKWLTTTSPAVVRITPRTGAPQEIHISADRDGTLQINGMPRGAEVTAHTGRETRTVRVDARGVLRVRYRHSNEGI